MDAACAICECLVESPRTIDLPAGLMLCDDCFEKYVWKCDSCQRHIARLTAGEFGDGQPEQRYRGEALCEECYVEEVAECSICHELGERDAMHHRGRHLLCKDCAEGRTATCDSCGCRIDPKHAKKECVKKREGDETRLYCEACAGAERED